jgi:uncharacterized protein (DUF2062 family)
MSEGLIQQPSFWRRRVVKPIADQLRQGIAPEKIAITVALGLTLSIFPILGSTMLLCGLAALFLRLNQPVIQLVNYFGYPVQLALLIPFYRAGESLFGQPHVPLSIPLFFERLRADVWQFFRDFGLIALEGIAVWCLIAPLLVLALYYTLRPLLRTLSRQLAR